MDLQHQGQDLALLVQRFPVISHLSVHEPFN